MKQITYSNNERELVKKGFETVQRILLGTDTDAKERLLFCLDYYMDPYYGQKLSYEAELIQVLETMIVTENSISVKEDALQLLCDYTWPPYPILQPNFDNVEDELKSFANYVIERQDD